MASIFAAVKSGNINKVQKFIDSGIDVNKKNNVGYTPLYIASLYGHENIVKLLIEANADVDNTNKKGRTPLIEVCHHGHLAVVKLLIEANADVNKTDDERRTPLFEACENGHLEVVKLLIEAKADVDSSGSDYRTPLLVASAGGYTDIVKLLIEAKANINILDMFDNTALSLACYNGHTDIVKRLIEAGADVNYGDHINNSALFNACYGGHIDIVKLLIENNAEITRNILYHVKIKAFIPEINELLLAASSTFQNNNNGNIVLNQVNKPTVTGNVSPSQCFNPIEDVYENITSNLTVFYQLKADGTVASIKCINNDDNAFNYYTKEKNNIFFKCKDTVKTSALHIRRKDTVGEPMYLMRFDTMIYVPYKQVKALQKGRMYVLEPTTEPVGRIVSLSVLEGGTVVGASHCGPATSDILYTIKEIKEPQSGGKRRTRRLRLRSSSSSSSSSRSMRPKATRKRSKRPMCATS